MCQVQGLPQAVPGVLKGEQRNKEDALAFDPGQVLWRTSSFTHGNDCVTVGEYGDMIAVRDSKDPEGGTLVFTRSEMAAFIAGIKAGEFDDLTS